MNDVAIYPEILGSTTEADGQLFVLQVRNGEGQETSLGLPHREIPRLIELAALQIEAGAQARGNGEVTAFNTREFSVGVSDGGQIVLTLTIGAAGKLAFVLPGPMSAQLSETLALANAKAAGGKPGEPVN